MKTLRFLLEKEFRQILRNPAILRMIFMMPIVQLMILPQVANYEIRNVNISVIDHDHSDYSRRLIGKITATDCFNLASSPASFNEALNEVEHDRSDLILEIPANFERTLVRENEAKLSISVNAINGIRANLGSAYLQSILQDFNADIRAEWFQMPKFDEITRVEVAPRNRYNPHMNYKLFMVPGILVILLTMTGANMASLNIVREKEIGTIEQINVTPIPKHLFIMGKLLPFWIIGFIVITIGLCIARFVYGIVPVGNIGLLYLFASVYLLAVLGLGLWMSTIAQSQQQAMLISFFIMMVFILLGGLYTSIESMPAWAQTITKFNPVSYFIEVMRMVVLKGSRLQDITHHLGIMAIFAVVLNSWAIWSYRKRS